MLPPGGGSLEHFAPALQVGGLGRSDEVREDRAEALRGVALRIVPHVLEDFEAAVGDGCVRGARMAHGDDPVTRPPDDQRREVRRGRVGLRA